LLKWELSNVIKDASGGCEERSIGFSVNKNLNDANPFGGIPGILDECFDFNINASEIKALILCQVRNDAENLDFFG
jgi:hypothetical protein